MGLWLLAATSTPQLVHASCGVVYNAVDNADIYMYITIYNFSWHFLAYVKYAQVW
jgi:hypothetical protein